MNTFELSKLQKRIARQVIDIGLMRELENSLGEIDHEIQQWKEVKDTKTTYHSVYQKLTKFNKHIARRYDEMKGSTYLFILAGLLADGIISDEELNVFDQEVKDRILAIRFIAEG